MGSRVMILVHSTSQECVLSFFTTVFSTHLKYFLPFSSNSRLQTLSGWMSLEFVIWERVTHDMCPLLSTVVCTNQ